MKVVDVLKEAYGAVEQANVPEDLRPIAFAKAIDLLTVPGTSNHDDPYRSGGTTKAGKQENTSDDSETIKRIASKLDIPDTLIDRIFDDHEGVLTFCGDIASLGKSNYEKVGSLALLFIAARRWADLDDGGATKDELVRAEIDRTGLLDVSNYSKHIASLKPLVTILGRGKDASYKIKFDGLEKAKKLARSLAGVDGGSQ